MSNKSILLPIFILSCLAGQTAIGEDSTHEQLLGHPWSYVLIDGERTDVAGALAFTITQPDQAAPDACDLLWFGSDGAPGGCTWLRVQGSIGCGSLDATLTTAAGRLFPPDVSTVYTRCSDREVIERIGDAIFRTRAYRLADGLLELLDDEGSPLLTLKASDADAQAGVSLPDEAPAVSPFYPACMAADWTSEGQKSEQEITSVCFCTRNSMASFGIPEEDVPLIARYFAGTASGPEVEEVIPGGLAMLAATVDYCLGGAEPGFR